MTLTSLKLKIYKLTHYFFYGLFIFTTIIAYADTNKHNPFSIYPFTQPSDLPKISGYRQWKRITGFEFSGLHWNNFIVIYTNTGEGIYKDNFIEFLRAYQDEEDDENTTHQVNFKHYDVGTIFVKENYESTNGSPGKPLSLTIMIKHKKGFDTKNGDWEYAQYSAKGEVILRGKHTDDEVKKTCSGCHINMQDRDFIFSTYYSEGSALSK